MHNMIVDLGMMEQDLATSQGCLNCDVVEVEEERPIVLAGCHSNTLVADALSDDSWSRWCQQRGWLKNGGDLRSVCCNLDARCYNQHRPNVSQ